MAKIVREKLNKTYFFLFLVVLLALVLRVWRLGLVPPGLFGDEVDTGYQAYSLFSTGRDYFGNLLPVHFQSYGDWRVPLYIYIDSLFVGLLGLSELAVRLPSALAGTLAVLASFFLALRLTANKKTALLTAFLVAISPWHVHFSRGAFEAIFLTLLFPLAIIFFFKAIEFGKGRDFILSAVFFSLTPYAYNTPKFLLPFILLVMFIIYKREILLQKRKWLVFLVVLVLLLSPMVWDTLRGPGIARFNSLSIFKDETVGERVRIARQNSEFSPTVQKLLYNKGAFWAADFTDNYLASFSTQFLFIDGDPNPRHSVLGRGQLYLFELPFLFLGFGLLFWQAFWKRKKTAWLILSFVFLVPIPAAITQNGGVHAIRLLSWLPWLQIITAMGVFLVAEKLPLRWGKIFWGLVLTALVLSLLLFIIDYHDQYPKTSGRWWNFGYRETFDYVNRVQDKYEQIYVSPSWEPSIVYTLFYSKYPPRKAQGELTISPDRVGKYWFLSPDVSRLKRGEGDPSTLYILNPAELEVYNLKLEEEPTLRRERDIFAPDGTPAFVIFSSSDVD